MTSSIFSNGWVQAEPSTCVGYKGSQMCGHNALLPQTGQGWNCFQAWREVVFLMSAASTAWSAKSTCPSSTLRTSFSKEYVIQSAWSLGQCTCTSGLQLLKVGSLCPPAFVTQDGACLLAICTVLHDHARTLEMCHHRYYQAVKQGQPKLQALMAFMTSSPRCQND